jgi:predicted ATPase/DNA-binding SARP family transcriptional activator
MGFEFRLLGPVEAAHDQRPIPLGAPKQRALLAVLLLNANEALSRERLIDQLWGTAAPRSAIQSLQVYVHGLRQALGSERIETRGTGYRLRLAPNELDLDRFERLLATGSESLASGRPADAAEELHTALGHWRGSALSDLGGEPVAAEAPLLQDRRLRALELLNEAQLALGRDAELLPELERLIAEEPYREPFRAQHVLALYRSGRQKEALEAYRSAREALVEELGIDPGPELQELEGRILRHDPSLAAPPPPEPPRLRLPTPPTALVGRGLEAVAVTALLRDEARLVTLTGAGGTGKTRLALAAAEALGRELRDGAVFVDLAAIRDPALLGPTIAQALEITEGASPEEALVEYLRDRRLLLLLDNFEQLIPHTELVGRLIAAAPRLLVLATSRAPLRLAAEHEYPVPPLALPEPDGATFEQLASNDAVRLFVARARAVDPAFELNDRNAREVACICERLDGLPLAIELAAARSKLFPPETMNRRLDRRLELLTGGACDRPARQQTLRATLEWSHELLDDAESAMFARFAVFAGGWTLEAAEAVCGQDGDDVLGPLSSLVDDSLVCRTSRSASEPRFAMLETVREYAIELLERAGETERFRRRHAEHMVEVAERAADVILTGGEAEQWYALLDEEHDNLRAALFWAAAAGELELGVRLTVALRWFWLVRGYLSEGRRFFDDVVARTEEAPKELRAAAVVNAGTFPFRQGDLDVAEKLFAEALDLYRALGDEAEIGRAIAELGAVAIARGDLDRASQLYEESLPIFRAHENDIRLAVALSNLGAIANMRKDAEAAIRYFDDAIALARSTGDEDGLGISLHNISRSYLQLERMDEGRDALFESLSIALRLGYRELTAYCIGGLAQVAMLEAAPELAARLLGAAEHLFADVGAAVDPDELDTQKSVRQWAVEELGVEEVDALRAAGADTPLDELLPVRR